MQKTVSKIFFLVSIGLSIQPMNATQDAYLGQSSTEVEEAYKEPQERERGFLSKQNKGTGGSHVRRRAAALGTLVVLIGLGVIAGRSFLHNGRGGTGSIDPSSADAFSFESTNNGGQKKGEPQLLGRTDSWSRTLMRGELLESMHRGYGKRRGDVRNRPQLPDEWTVQGTQGPQYKPASIPPGEGPYDYLGE